MTVKMRIYSGGDGEVVRVAKDNNLINLIDFDEIPSVGI